MGMMEKKMDSTILHLGALQDFKYPSQELVCSSGQSFQDCLFNEDTLIWGPLSLAFAGDGTSLSSYSLFAKWDGGGVDFMTKSSIVAALSLFASYFSGLASLNLRCFWYILR